MARGQELFGHQVHTVVQRSHEAQVGGAVEALDLAVAVVALAEDDGLPLRGLEAPVDALGFGVNLGQEIVVALDVGAAGRADLHEGEAALVARILFQKTLDRPEAFEDSLGVIDAVNAHAEQQSFDAQLLDQGGALVFHRAVTQGEDAR